MYCEKCKKEVPDHHMMPSVGCFQCWAREHNWTYHEETDSISPPEREEVKEMTTTSKVKYLMEASGYGLGDCRRALLLMGNDHQIAKTYLRNKGQAVVRKSPRGKAITGGDHMSLGQFITCCNEGGFIDYDGYGQYASDKQVFQDAINPSDVTDHKDDIKTWFTHVVWYNN